MPVPKNRFIAARLKVHRAHRHIAELNHTLVRFLDSNPCKVVIKDEPNTGKYLLQLVSEPALPAEFSFAIGDAAHNLRAALDYVTSEIVGTDDDRVHFPFASSRDDLVATDKYRRIEKADMKIAETILHDIKPYPTGNPPLCALNRIDNIDKHRLLIPTFAVTGIVIDAKTENGCDFTGLSLHVGTGGTLNAIGSPSKFKITKYGKPTGDIFFPDGGVFENEPIIPTLTQLGGLVAGVIETLEIAYFGVASP